MKILVTGGAGFIGFHLIKVLLENGCNVVSIDNINDYYDQRLKFDRLDNLNLYFEKLNRENNNSCCYEFHKMDLSDKGSILSLFEKENFDVVVNLAAQAGVRYSIENPNAYMESNMVGFLNILEGCRSINVKHLLYASSSSVYGMNTKVPFSTDDNVDYPISLYAATKKSNELMAHTYSHLYEIPVTGLRFFTVYGPWGRPDMAYFSFAEKIVQGSSINIFNHGNMLRDFTYIDDIVSGIFKLLNKIPARKSQNGTKAAAAYRVFNIGNNKPVKLGDFISTLEESIGGVAKKNYLPMQPGDVPCTFADISELKKEINFQPSTNISTGLKKFADWFLEYKNVGTK